MTHTGFSRAQHTHIRVRPTTPQKLRLLSAITGETMMDIVDRLVDKELEKHPNAAALVAALPKESS